MTYLVKLEKSAVTLVKELFNYHNDNTFNIEDLELRGTPTQTTGLYNTIQEIGVSVATDTQPAGFAAIHYNRIDLATLFSKIVVEVNEVAIIRDAVSDLNLILDEIQRQHLLNTAAGGFSITTDMDDIYFHATVDNPAFIGSVAVTLEKSLGDRLPNEVLNGFAMPSPSLTFGNSMISHTPPAGLDIDRYAYGSCALGDHIYFHGGLRQSGSSGLANRLFRYTPATNTWLELESSIKHVWFGAMVTDGTDLYVVCGNSRAGELLRYEVATGTWTDLAEIASAATDSVTATYHNGKIHAIIDKVYSVYDIATDTWTTKPLSLGSKYLHCRMTTYNDTLFVVVGKEVRGYNINTLEPMFFLPLEQDNTACSILIHEDYFYICGGYANNSPLSNFICLDLIGGVIIQLPDLPGPKSFFTMDVVNNKLIVMQGYTSGEVLIYSK